MKTLSNHLVKTIKRDIINTNLVRQFCSSDADHKVYKVPNLAVDSIVLKPNLDSR